MINPHDLLPIADPIDTPIAPMDFYYNVVKPLIPDILRMMSNGILLDMNRVKELETFVVNALEESSKSLKESPIVQAYLENKQGKQIREKKKELIEKKKDYTEYVKPFNPNNIIHRSLAVNYYLITSSHSSMQKDRWSINDIKKLLETTPSVFLENLLKKTPMHNKITQDVEKELAEQKKEKEDKKIEERQNKAEETIAISDFNPASSLQREELFDYIGVMSSELTKGGKKSYNKDYLEDLLKQIERTIEEKEIESYSL
jgi:hypothetical protein